MLPPVSRRTSPATTTSTLVVREEDLDDLIGPSIDERIGIGRAREREAVRDERQEIELGEEVERVVRAPRAVPAWRERRIHRPDLRADETQTRAMEATAKREHDRLGAIPRCDDDGRL